MDKAAKTAECAYFIWLRAGRPEGKALEYWLQAEAELAAKSLPETASASPAPLAEKAKQPQRKNK